jgi:SSS family solute:Na+ symporter
VTFSLLIWFFIPFLLSAKVFTTPEYLELRFSAALRQIFAVVTVISNVVAFLAGVLYGGALALESLFGWDPWFAIIALGIVSGMWAIYGGLSSVAWTDLLTVVVMILGGLTITVLGLDTLAGDDGSLIDGFHAVIERNQATQGAWAEAVNTNTNNLSGGESDSYNRLSLFQGVTHPILPVISFLPFIFSVSVWYNVLNQFMIQRVLGARSEYDARMGIVFAGWIKVFVPLITVLPGMVLFALHPEILLGSWEQVKPEADKGYVQMVQSLVPVGLRGLFLAALFGAIQSTVNSVLNSTSTIVTLDIYKRVFHPQASDRHLVRAGVISSVIILAIAIVLGGFVGKLGGSLFEYIQSLYAFFAPPFAAVFVLGILWRRINGAGALATVVSGFVLGIAIKLYMNFAAEPPPWLAPYANQASLNWFFCLAVCVGVSLLTSPPRAEQVTDQLTFNWRKMNIVAGLGDRWYSSVVTWWGLFIVTILALFVLFSGFVL